MNLTVYCGGPFEGFFSGFWFHTSHASERTRVSEPRMGPVDTFWVVKAAKIHAERYGVPRVWLRTETGPSSND